MGFFKDLAKSAMQGMEERAQKVSDRKEELESNLEYASDEEIFRMISRYSPTSVDFAALSLILQDRGYSGDDITRRYNEMKHGR